ADEVAVGDGEVQARGRVLGRVFAGEAGLGPALARATVTVYGVAVVAFFRRKLEAIAAFRRAGPAASGLESARGGTTVAIHRVAVVAGLSALLRAIATFAGVTGGGQLRLRRIADEAGLQPTIGAAALAGVRQLALLGAQGEPVATMRNASDGGHQAV